MYELDPQQAAAILEGGIGRMRADPLESWRHQSRAQRIVLEQCGRGEILVGGGNKSGKTSIAALFVALARGERSLDGVELPAIPQPSEWVVTSLDFEQQKLSVQPKYLAMIGDWPHDAHWDREVLKSVRIKYQGCKSDNPKDWSRITFISCKNLQAGTGYRGNGYHCDEPPPMWLLQELRKMAEAGQLVVGVITATMLKPSQWRPLRLDYPDPHANEGKWVGPFLRLRQPAFNPNDLDDELLGNWALTRRDREDLLAKYANDPLRDARILGLEVNTEGDSPFRSVFDAMQADLDRCRPGQEIEWKVSRKHYRGTQQIVTTDIIGLESWADVNPAHVYRVIVDPSLGIAGDGRDPTLVEVFDMTDRIQVARWSGYIGEFGAGTLGGSLSKHFNDAKVRVFVTGGYGQGGLDGLAAVGCRAIDTRDIKDRSGRLLRKDVGIVEDAESRSRHVSAIVQAYEAHRRGHPYITLNSREDIAELMDLTLDDKNRPVTKAGAHDEALAVVGEFCWLANPSTPAPAIRPERQRIPLSPIDKMRLEAGLPIRKFDGARPRPARRAPVRKPPKHRHYES